MAGRDGVAYRDASLPLEQRVADLVGRMTLEEKVSQIRSRSPAIPRLDIPEYHWGGECLHGLVHTGRATVFPSAIAFGATFDTGLVRRVASAIGDEARAKYHDPAWQSPSVAITFWTPNINIVRDPRWGRAQETYGEDPFLTGTIGAAFVRGLQGGHPRYLKATACAKHFAVHNGPEHLRRAFDARVSLKDLHESYLPAFRMLIDAGVASVMATYNRVNGEPCPCSTMLLRDILREDWGFQGFVTSDAGAIQAAHEHHKATRDRLDSAVQAIKAGCDMEIGSDCYDELPAAVERGLVDEADIDLALSRVLTARFRLGMFDEPRNVPFARTSGNVIQCDGHIALAREAAVKSVVMLKNNGVLPLGREHKTVFVTGPNSVDLDVLLGNFYRGASARLVSILEGVVGAAPDGTAVTCMTGSFLKHEPDYASSWPVGLAEWADAVVAVVGVSPLMEGEDGECIGSMNGGDRDRLELPPNQVEFVRNIAGAGKPLVLVVTGGTPVAMPELHELADAALFVWYPGEQGGAAVGDLLFGHESPSGRLPMTFPRTTAELPAFEDYSMAGRTYRFMQREPLYPFGFGLSYTRFEYGPLVLSANRLERGQPVGVAVEVTNVGGREAEEVVQLYLSDDEASVRVPRCSLVGFRRISLEPAESKTVEFDITPQMMEVVLDDGTRALEPGSFTVVVGGSLPGRRSVQLGAPEPAKGQFELT